MCKRQVHLFNVLLLVLCVCLCVYTFGCSETVHDNAFTTADSTTNMVVTEPSNPSLEETLAVLGQYDYDGYIFTVLDRSELYDSYWYTYDVYSDGINGEVINDAVYGRNLTLEELYNIKITEESVPAPYENAKKTILASDDAYDVLTDGLYSLATLTNAGLLLDYYGIPGIDLSNVWWDQKMNVGMSVNNRLFYATGDISVMDNEGTWCILFNKNLAKEYTPDDLYTLVNDGKWTIAKMYEIAKAAAADLNGDSKMTIDDQWGLLTESFNTYGFWAGGDNRIVSKDKNDLPYITMYNDHSVSVLEEVLALQLDKKVTFSSSMASDYTAFQNVFSDGRAMFLYCSMGMITQFRASDTDFGVLPAMKYDETQESYCNTYSYFNFTAYSVPVTVADPTRTGSILEAMAAISLYKLTPAYYDVSLKGKFLRDTESEGMLDLILATRSYDLGSSLGWGGAMDTLINASASFDFASAYAKIESKITSDINDYITKLAANK